MTAPESPQPTVTDNAQRQRYEISLDGEVAGFLDYRSEDGLLVLVHTEIHSKFAGRGLGQALVGGVLDDLASRGQQVRIECEFAQKFVERNPKYARLVA